MPGSWYDRRARSTQPLMTFPMTDVYTGPIGLADILHSVLNVMRFLTDQFESPNASRRIYADVYAFASLNLATCPDATSISDAA